MAKRERVIAGRNQVDAYRIAHAKLYEKGWHRGIPEEHTPLLNIMLKAFKGLGFDTIQEFFDASEQLNIQELGFASKEDFEGKANEADREALRLRWS